MKAVICPVCNGAGKLSDPNSTAVSRPCHGCNGLGWVQVSEEIPTVTISPWPYYYYYRYPAWDMTCTVAAQGT